MLDIEEDRVEEGGSNTGKESVGLCPSGKSLRLLFRRMPSWLILIRDAIESSPRLMVVEPMGSYFVVDEPQVIPFCIIEF